VTRLSDRFTPTLLGPQPAHAPNDSGSPDLGLEQRPQTGDKPGRASLDADANLQVSELRRDERFDPRDGIEVQSWLARPWIGPCVECSSRGDTKHSAAIRAADEPSGRRRLLG
jgi:hypothetical protein